MKTKILFFAAVIVFLALATNGRAQNKVRINWTAVTGAQSGLFMAKQEGLFKKNGLDAELIHIPSNIAKEGSEYVSVAIDATRSYLSANENIARRECRGENKLFAEFPGAPDKIIPH